MWAFIFLTLASLKVPAESLKDLRVYIPETVLRGHNAVFNCTFNFDEDETLYAIKWYRGTYEIFRYIPSDEPPTKSFPLSGYNVSMAHSTGKTMVLNKADFVNSGAYSCEVIADLTFHTLIETKHMLVIDLPDKKPRITGLNSKYNVGGLITATCTSWQSHPPANLSWFINGEPAREAYLRRYKLREEYDGTFTSVLGLHFSIAKYHFIDGKMTLKCTSSMLSVYWQSSEVQIKESALHPSQISDLVGSGTSQVSPHTNKNKKKKRKRKDSNVNRNINNKMKMDNVRSGVANTKNMPVEGLTHHVLSSSSKISSSITFSFFSVIQVLIPIVTTLPHVYFGRVLRHVVVFILSIFCLIQCFCNTSHLNR